MSHKKNRPHRQTNPLGDQHPLPQVRQPNQIAVQHASFSAFQGPLPPPEMLAQYNNCLPNGAERIVALAERQAEHRQTLESAVVQGNLRAERFGQVAAFILGLVAIIGGIVLIALGKDVQGIAAIVVAFTGLASTFIYGRHQQQKERERKRQEIREAQAQQRLPYDSPSN